MRIPTSSFVVSLSGLYTICFSSLVISRKSADAFVSTPSWCSIKNDIHSSNRLIPFIPEKKQKYPSHSAFAPYQMSFVRSVELFMTSEDETLIKAEDGEALQTLFEQFCDDDGLMTKEALVRDIASIRELLEVGDLLQEELDDIWDAAPKFPDLENTSVQRIDVDSFIQIYRDIDDIFEDVEEVEQLDDKMDDTMNRDVESILESTLTDNMQNEEIEIFEEEGSDPEIPTQNEQMLEQAFNNICNDKKLVSKQALENWSEIKTLFEDGLLGQDEFDSMWEKTTKSPGLPDMIDVDGFLSFNVALDDLFEIDDMNDDDFSDESTQIPMFYADDLPPGVIFAEIANENSLVGMNELRSWGDLQQMLRDGDLLPIELQNLYDQIPKVVGTDALDEAGFEQLFNAIEDLFEDGDEENSKSDTATVEQDTSSKLKSDLLDLITKLANDGGKLPCGLEDDETQAELVLDRVLALEASPSNMVSRSDVEVSTANVAGKWELLYTTSSTMKFNQGLSGLVPIGTGKFVGLTQSLVASKYLQDVEYVEKIAAGPAEFQVKVNGAWELRSSVSLFTGSKSVSLSVEPDKVTYWGPTTRADHWKSLGPLNLLDIAYLDDDLRIMRGTTAITNVFIFKRIQ